MRILWRLLVRVVCLRPPAEFVVVPVLVLLILILAGPALLSTRDKARKQQKAAGFQQIGVSLHSYHDSNQSFPASPNPKQKPPVRRRETPTELVSPF